MEKEIKYLKKLLAGAGISYAEKEINSGGNEYDPDQGLYQEVLQKQMQKCSLACFGDARMYTVQQLWIWGQCILAGAAGTDEKIAKELLEMTFGNESIKGRRYKKRVIKYNRQFFDK